MKAHIVDREALLAVTPLALRAYATAEGWVSVEQYGGHSQVYAFGDVGEIILPGTQALADYANVVADIIRNLASVENRDELQVYRDIASADRDVVRVRLPEADDDGSVGVEVGVQLVSSARDLMLSAACAAWNPQRSYRAGRVGIADSYMSKVRMGQTEQGSFVVTLLAPVPPQIEPQQENLWGDVLNEPFERKVTRRLSGGLDAAASAIEQYNLGGGVGVFEESVHKGVSSNLFDAASRLSDRDDGFEVSITWARTRPTPHRRWSRSFTRADGEVMREVSRIFRERRPRPDELVRGFVTKLAREGQQPGQITLKGLIDDKWVAIKAILTGDDYGKAIAAHEGVRQVDVTGTLERIGHRWWLSSARDLELVEDDSDDDGDLTDFMSLDGGT